jgi:hypothetical protein
LHHNNATNASIRALTLSRSSVHGKCPTPVATKMAEGSERRVRLLRYNNLKRPISPAITLSLSQRVVNRNGSHECLMKIGKLASPDLLELDEPVMVTWTYDPTPCHRSYELLAQAFEDLANNIECSNCSNSLPLSTSKGSIASLRSNS